MDIKKFKLLGEGFTGIKIEGTDIKPKENADVLVDLKMTYKIPVPGELVSLLQGLKYHFLEITGIGPGGCDAMFDFEYDLPKLRDYDKSYNRDLYAHINTLMQNLFVTGFRYDGKVVLITAKMKGQDDLTFAINTPLIQFAIIRAGRDAELERLVQKIKKNVTEFVEDVKLRRMPARQFLLDLFEKDEEKQIEVNNMTDQQAEDMQIEKLKEKGFIVFKGEEVMGEMHEINAGIPNVPIEEQVEETKEIPGMKEAEEVFQPVDDGIKDYVPATPTAKEFFIPETGSPVPEKVKVPRSMKPKVHQEA